MNVRKHVRLIVALLLSTCLFVYLFAKYGTARTLASFKEIEHWHLLAAILVAVISNVIVSSEQWRCALAAAGCPISFRESVFLKLSIYPIKGVLPLKSGEYLRAGYLKVQHNFPWVKAIGSVTFALAINAYLILLTSTVCCVLSFAELGWRSGQLAVVRHVFPFLAVATLLATIGGLLIVATTLGQRAFLALAGRASLSLRTKLAEQLVSFEAVGLRRSLPAVFYGICALYMDILVYYLLVNGLGVRVPLVAVFTFVPITIILTNLPVSIFGLGVREASLLFFLSSYVPKGTVENLEHRLIASGVLFSVVDYLLFAAIGLLLVKRLIDRITGDPAQAD